MMYDLFSSENLANPYPVFDEMRAENPVYFLEDIQCWMLTRYQDVESAFKNKNLISDKRELFSHISLDFSKITHLTKLVSNFIVEQDPPEHTLRRNLAQPIFTSKQYERWVFIIDEVTTSLVESFKSKYKNEGEDEIIDNCLKYIPIRVLLKLSNISESYLEQIMKATSSIIRFWECMGNTDDNNLIENAEKSAEFLINFFQDVINQRKNNLGDDIISILIEIYDKSGISDEKLIYLCSELFIAGTATTIDAMANTLYLLLSNETEFSCVKEKPNLISSAVEEALRLEPPGVVTFRLAKDDIEINNTVIAKGDVVALSIGAANRDPGKFNEPQVFNIFRSPNEHLTFAKGSHSCLGSVLARLQINKMLESVIKIMPSIRLNFYKPPIIKRNSLIFKSFYSLYINI